MGIFDTIKGIGSSIVKGTKELFAGGVTMLPTNLITRVEEKVQPFLGQRSFTKEEKAILIGTGVAAATLASAPIVLSVAGRSSISYVASTVGKALVPKTLLGIGGSVLLAGAAVSSPKVREAVLNLPSTIFKAGETVGKAVEEGKVPFVPTTPLGVVAAGVGLVAAGAAAAYVADKVMDNKTVSPTTDITTPLVPATIETNDAFPTTSETTKISTTKRKRRTKKKEDVNMNQNVKILVNNEFVQNKRYLNAINHR